MKTFLVRLQILQIAGIKNKQRQEEKVDQTQNQNIHGDVILLS